MNYELEKLLLAAIQAVNTKKAIAEVSTHPELANDRIFMSSLIEKINQFSQSTPRLRDQYDEIIFTLEKEFPQNIEDTGFSVDPHNLHIGRKSAAGGSQQNYDCANGQYLPGGLLQLAEKSQAKKVPSIETSIVIDVELFSRGTTTTPCKLWEIIPGHIIVTPLDCNFHAEFDGTWKGKLDATSEARLNLIHGEIPLGTDKIRLIYVADLGSVSLSSNGEVTLNKGHAVIEGTISAGVTGPNVGLKFNSAAINFLGLQFSPSLSGSVGYGAKATAGGAVRFDPSHGTYRFNGVLGAYAGLGGSVTLGAEIGSDTELFNRIGQRAEKIQSSNPLIHDMVSEISTALKEAKEKRIDNPGTIRGMLEERWNNFVISCYEEDLANWTAPVFSAATAKEIVPHFVESNKDTKQLEPALSNDAKYKDSEKFDVDHDSIVDEYSPTPALSAHFQKLSAPPSPTVALTNSMPNSYVDSSERACIEPPRSLLLTPETVENLQQKRLEDIEASAKKASMFQDPRSAYRDIQAPQTPTTGLSIGLSVNSTGFPDGARVSGAIGNMDVDGKITPGAILGLFQLAGTAIAWSKLTPRQKAISTFLGKIEAGFNTKEKMCQFFSDLHKSKTLDASDKKILWKAAVNNSEYVPEIRAAYLYHYSDELRSCLASRKEELVHEASTPTRGVLHDPIYGYMTEENKALYKALDLAIRTGNAQEMIKTLLISQPVASTVKQALIDGIDIEKNTAELFRQQEWSFKIKPRFDAITFHQGQLKKPRKISTTNKEVKVFVDKHARTHPEMLPTYINHLLQQGQVEEAIAFLEQRSGSDSQRILHQINAYYTKPENVIQNGRQDSTAFPKKTDKESLKKEYHAKIDKLSEEGSFSEADNIRAQGFQENIFTESDEEKILSKFLYDYLRLEKPKQEINNAINNIVTDLDKRHIIDSTLIINIMSYYCNSQKRFEKAKECYLRYAGELHNERNIIQQSQIQQVLKNYIMLAMNNTKAHELPDIDDLERNLAHGLDFPAIKDLCRKVKLLFTAANSGKVMEDTAGFFVNICRQVEDDFEKNVLLGMASVSKILTTVFSTHANFEKNILRDAEAIGDKLKDQTLSPTEREGLEKKLSDIKNIFYSACFCHAASSIIDTTKSYFVKPPKRKKDGTIEYEDSITETAFDGCSLAAEGVGTTLDTLSLSTWGGWDGARVGFQFVKIGLSATEFIDRLSGHLYGQGNGFGLREHPIVQTYLPEGIRLGNGIWSIANEWSTDALLFNTAMQIASMASPYITPTVSHINPYMKQYTGIDIESSLYPTNDYLIKQGELQPVDELLTVVACIDGVKRATDMVGIAPVAKVMTTTVTATATAIMGLLPAAAPVVSTAAVGAGLAIGEALIVEAVIGTVAAEVAVGTVVAETAAATVVAEIATGAVVAETTGAAAAWAQASAYAAAAAPYFAVVLFVGVGGVICYNVYVCQYNRTTNNYIINAYVEAGRGNLDVAVQNFIDSQKRITPEKDKLTLSERLVNGARIGFLFKETQKAADTKLTSKAEYLKKLDSKEERSKQKEHFYHFDPLHIELNKKNEEIDWNQFEQKVNARIQADPEFQGFKRDLAACFFRQNQYDTMLASIRAHGTYFNPEDAYGFLIHGIAQLRVGHTRSGRETLDKVKAITQTDANKANIDGAKMELAINDFDQRIIVAEITHIISDLIYYFCKLPNDSDYNKSINKLTEYKYTAISSFINLIVNFLQGEINKLRTKDASDPSRNTQLAINNIRDLLLIEKILRSSAYSGIFSLSKKQIEFLNNWSLVVDAHIAPYLEFLRSSVQIFIGLGKSLRPLINFSPESLIKAPFVNHYLLNPNPGDFSASLRFFVGSFLENLEKNNNAPVLINNTILKQPVSLIKGPIDYFFRYSKTFQWCADFFKADDLVDTLYYLMKTNVFYSCFNELIRAINIMSAFITTIKDQNKKIIQYLNTCCNQEMISAYYCLGEIYEQGDIVEGNIVTAVKYYQQCLDNVYMSNNPLERIMLNIQASRKLNQLLASEISANDLNMIAVLYRDGQGVRKNDQLAQSLFEKYETKKQAEQCIALENIVLQEASLAKRKILIIGLIHAGLFVASIPTMVGPTLAIFSTVSWLIYQNRNKKSQSTTVEIDSTLPMLTLSASNDSKQPIDASIISSIHTTKQKKSVAFSEEKMPSINSAKLDCFSNDETLSNGNCAFNSIVLFIRDCYLNLVENNEIIICITTVLTQENVSACLGLKTVTDFRQWFQNQTSEESQHLLAPILRQMAVKVMREPSSGFKANHLVGLKNMIDFGNANPTNRDLPDAETFLVHECIRDQWQRICMSCGHNVEQQKNAMEAWWNEHGCTQYLEAMQIPASNASDKAHWGSNIELDILGKIFQFSIHFNCEGQGHQICGDMTNDRPECHLILSGNHWSYQGRAQARTFSILPVEKKLKDDSESDFFSTIKPGFLNKKTKIVVQSVSDDLPKSSDDGYETDEDEKNALESLSRDYIKKMKSRHIIGSDVIIENVDDYDSDDEASIWTKPNTLLPGKRVLSVGFSDLSKDISFWALLKEKEYSVQQDNSIQLPTRSVRR